MFHRRPGACCRVSLRSQPVSARGVAMLLAAAVMVAPAVVPASAQECPEQYNPLKNVYFGDLHTHTSYSLDAIVYGATTRPEDAYLFARGEEVEIAGGADTLLGDVTGPEHVTIGSVDRWLDFNAVTDHSEWLSTAYGCTVHDTSPFYGSSYCTILRTPNEPIPPNDERPCDSDLDVAGTGCEVEQMSAWDAERDAADSADNPCTFTAFKAYEWTKEGEGSMLGNKVSLHKNVIFKGTVTPDLPFTALTHTDSQSLWSALAAECNGTNGCDAITIPHSLNQSSGQAFSISGYSATDLNRRMKYQRLVEVHQHKGNSECMTDTADNGDITICGFEADPLYAQPGDAPGYARPGMEAGLYRYSTHGDNPVKIGFVGATDNHNSASGNVAEASWIGNLAAVDNTPARRLGDYDRRTDNPGGITGVWAEENTRSSIFEALRRRESFATSGPKIRVRFYQVNTPLDPCLDPDFPAAIVAAGGVPMGGTMATRASAPKFVVYATEDETPLAAVDIVKASIVGGAVVEKVFTIALPAAAPHPPGCVVWVDPDFQGDDPAFYYARVREEPTWRWSHYDCEALKLSNPIQGPTHDDWNVIAPGCGSSDPLTGGLDFMIRERAWTSAIWYLPGGPVTVRTTKLLLRDGTPNGNPGRRKLKFVSKTRGNLPDHRVVVPDAGSDGDPTAAGGSDGGGSVTLYNPDTGETVVHELPAAGWTEIPGGYQFASATGPIRNVTVLPDLLTVLGRRPALGFTLDEDHQESIALQVQLGSADPWCALATARDDGDPFFTTFNDTVGRFTSMRGVAPPDQCPLVTPP